MSVDAPISWQPMCNREQQHLGFRTRVRDTTRISKAFMTTRIRRSWLPLPWREVDLTKSQAYYSNSLAVQVIENDGQVRVTHSGTGQPLPTVYVKGYAQMQDGTVRFFKDGYTDLRGRFEYTSLSTNELDFAQEFSLLILSDDHGAVVREADPPKR
jgi:hypothetical protein